jgi:hypothetical protein
MHIAAASCPGNNSTAAKTYQPFLFLLLTEIIGRPCLAMPGVHAPFEEAAKFQQGFIVW